jgi:hypothetical protein
LRSRAWWFVGQITGFSAGWCKGRLDRFPAGLLDFRNVVGIQKIDRFTSIPHEMCMLVSPRGLLWLPQVYLIELDENAFSISLQLWKLVILSRFMNLPKILKHRKNRMNKFTSWKSKTFRRK